jgi:hypothetical protein
MICSQLGRTMLGIAFLVGASGVCTASSEIVTTTDGRTIELRDDGTLRVLSSPAPTPEPGAYQQIALEDVALDALRLNGKLVKLRGTLAALVIRTDIVSLTLWQRPSMTGIRLGIRQDRLTRDQKRAILQSCEVTCPAVVRGELIAPSTGTLVSTEIVAHDLRLGRH